MSNIPVYDSAQDPDKVKMETNPAYQEMPSDHNRKGPDPAYQDLLSHSGRANVSKPAGDVNYYEDCEIARHGCISRYTILHAII